MNKFSPNDFNYEFDTEFVADTNSNPVDPPKPKIVLNAYKQFKAIRNKETYYMSGVNRRGY